MQRLIFLTHAVNAAAIRAGTNIDFREAFRRNPARMLDKEAIDIDDVERAVRSSARLHGTKPMITRAEKFGILFVGRASAGQKQIAGENFAMNEVMDRFAGKNIAVIFRSQMAI